MRDVSFLLCALVLAGCGGPGRAATGQTQDAARAECQRQAVNDPAVQALIERANSPLQAVRVEGVHDQEVATRLAVQRCLAGRAGAPVGGVEPVQGGWLGPSLF